MSNHGQLFLASTLYFLLLFQLSKLATASEVSEIEPLKYSIDSSDGSIGTTSDPPCLKSDRLIDRFDPGALLPAEPAAETFMLFKQITFVKTSLGRPFFFPAYFSIYTRRQNITNLEFGEQLHCLNISLGYDNKFRETFETYEFDLKQLSSLHGCLDLQARRTIIVIPGYLTAKNAEWMFAIRDRWLDYDDVNVILVDWPKGNHCIYPSAVTNLRLVSRQITMFLYYLAQMYQVDFESNQFRNNLYLVGHSLGAHIAGWVGHELRGEVNRITGLDPAGPILDNLPERDRLNPKNAKFVDVIHTNAGTMSSIVGLCSMSSVIGRKSSQALARWIQINSDFCETPMAPSLLANYQRYDSDIYLGIQRPIGHLDYYPNGGSLQPGCDDELRICDHTRAFEIYTNAIAFEYQARQHLNLDAESIRKSRHRLFAFPSLNYDKYKSGVSFLRNCPKLLDTDANTGPDNEELWRILRKCVIPLDFVTPAMELLNLLTNFYAVPALKLSLEKPSDIKYFFDTSASEPFVSEHYLLKIHMYTGRDANQDTLVYESGEVSDEPRSIRNLAEPEWNQACQMRVITKSYESDNLYSAFDLSLNNLNPIGSKNLYALTVIFANPINWTAHHPATLELGHNPVETSNEIVTHQEEQEGLDIDINPKVLGINRLVNFLPRKIILGLNDKSGYMQKAYRSMLGMLSQAHEILCNVKVTSVQVEPVFKISPYVSARYGLQPEADEEKQTVGLQQVRFVRNLQPLNESHAYDLSSSDGTSNLTLSLENIALT